MMTVDVPQRRNRKRNRAVRRLFFRLGVHIIWWDVLLTRGPLKRFRTPPTPRWAALAVEFRQEAEQLGGVLIKLGQFVSSRVDLLPAEVTDVLAELHDAVPPAPVEAVIDQIETDFRRPVTQLFAEFTREPIGSASLAQAYRARLPDMRPVVVKVLRPGVAETVENDLEVVGRFIRRLRGLPSIRRLVDLDVLAHEFVTVTRKELDLTAEAKNSRRFAEDFEDDPLITTPRLYPAWSGKRTLTMEDVSWFPIQEAHRYEATGISRHRVACTLMDCYLEQLYLKNFVHCDPHPGNLFVRPLPMPGEITTGWSPEKLATGKLTIPYAPERPFQIVFIDFGMAVPIPEQYRRSFRTYAIGMGTRDAYTIVQSYIEGDILMPDTDVAELEGLISSMLNRFPGAFVGQVKDSDLDQYEKLFGEYQKLLYQSPLKMKAELLFIFRAMGVCAGTVTRVDPGFDPSERFTPMVQRLLAEEWSPSAGQFKRLILFLALLPTRLDDMLTQLERGKLTVRIDDADRRREMKTLSRAANRLTSSILLGAIFLGGVVLASNGEATTASFAILGGSIIAAAAILRGMR